MTIWAQRSSPETRRQLRFRKNPKPNPLPIQIQQISTVELNYLILTRIYIRSATNPTPRGRKPHSAPTAQKPCASSVKKSHPLTPRNSRRLPRPSLSPSPPPKTLERKPSEETLKPMDLNGVASAFDDDGFTAARLFSQGVTYAYNDVIIHPGFIDFPADAVDLSSRLSRNFPLSIPCVASPMDTVSEASMAVAMASLGGAAIVHSNASPSRQASVVSSAKSRRIPFASDPVFVSPSDSLTSESDFGSSNFLIVTESGSSKSKPVGVVARSDWESLSEKDSPVSGYMRPAPKCASAGHNFEQLAAFLADEKLQFAPIVAGDGEVLDLVTDEIVQRIRSYPKLGSPSLGPDGRFLVGAAIGTREDDKERLEHLVKAGANVIVIDSSQGNSTYQIDMIKYAKSRFPGLDVIGGNVVTMAQAHNLIKAGVDGLRVGMGSGSICTTQEVCAVGRGQVNFTAFANEIDICYGGR